MSARAKWRMLAAITAGAACLIGVSSNAGAQTPAVQGGVWLGPAVGTPILTKGGVGTEGDMERFGASVGARFGALVVGGSADISVAPFGHAETFLAANAGLSLAANRLRLTVLAEAGQHAYSDVGRDIFSNVTVTSTTAALPFVGVRSVLDFGLGQQRTTLIGLWFNARTDIGTTTTTAGGETWEVGGTSVAGGLHIGFDLGGTRPKAVPHPDR